MNIAAARLQRTTGRASCLTSQRYARLRLHSSCRAYARNKSATPPVRWNGSATSSHRSATRRSKLTPDLSDHHGLIWRLGAIERRETGKRT